MGNLKQKVSAKSFYSPRFSLSAMFSFLAKHFAAILFFPIWELHVFLGLPFFFFDLLVTLTTRNLNSFNRCRCQLYNCFQYVAFLSKFPSRVCENQNATTKTRFNTIRKVTTMINFHDVFGLLSISNT